MESRLRYLIEIQSAQLFTPKKEQDDLISRMVAAMTSGSVEMADGRQVAPNLYTLIVPPAYSRILNEDRYLIEELSRMIYEAGTKAGFCFDSPPLIKVATAADVSQKQIQVFAEVTPGEMSNTSTIPKEIDETSGAIPENAFLIVGGNHVFPLNKTVINIGRRSDNDLVIDEGQVSRLHAQIRAIKGRYVIFDLDSKGGTMVNGERINKCKLYPGDVISLASFPLVYGQEDEIMSNDAAGLTRPIDTSPNNE
ncbi:MAG: FhaA domain-containing protein [Anaerolineales bacterium]